MKTEILFENKEVLVVHKPAGIAVQTAQLGRPDVVSELKNYLAAGKPPYLGVIHRLDQPVEGVLVFAKTPKSAAALTAQLKNGDFCKEYLAVVCGQPPETEGTLVDYLVKEQACAKVVDPAARPDAKRAVLHYSVQDRRQEGGRELSLLRVMIETGRFHQIRAQLSHAGLPILGDSRYGSPEDVLFARGLGVKDAALCAVKLSFADPVSGKTLNYSVQPRNGAFALFSAHEK